MIPTCPKPQNLQAINVTTTSIELGWTEIGSATTWEIAYGAPGFDPDDASTTIETATSNPFTINNLNSTTTYEFYVRAICGGSDVSYWSNVLQASTSMISVDLPYSTDFAAGSDVAWMLNNGSCGLIDLNLNQKQLCLGAYAGTYTLNDYAAFMLGGRPNQGQSLGQLRDLLLGQIDLLKDGQFDESLLEASINQLKLQIMKQAESNNSRASQMAYAFVQHQNWGDVCNEINELAKITKKDIVDFANRIFKDNNYVIKILPTPWPRSSSRPSPPSK